MSNKFIPKSNDEANVLNEELSSTIFKNASGFVELYNSEIINKKNDEVRRVLDRIIETFKNVKEQGARLIFLSEAEIALNEITESLRVWAVITKSKRVAQDAAESNEIDEESILAFSNKHNGHLLKVTYNTDLEENILQKISSEKVYGKFDEVEDLISSGKIRFEEENGIYAFKASELLNLDESFLVDANELVK